jgi:hypothetical protein
MALEDNLIHWWDLNDHTDLTDQVGTNDLTVEAGTPSTAVAVGPGGQDVVDLTNNAWLLSADILTFPGSLLSVAMWARPITNNALSNNYASHFFSGSGLGQWNFSESSDIASFSLLIGAGGAYTVSAARTLDVWYHYVFTHDGTTLRMYVDGVEVDTEDTSAGGFRTGSQNLRIGAANGPNTLNFLRGNVMSYGIWNDVIVQADVDNLYNGGDGISFAEFPEPEPEVVPRFDPQPFLDDLSLRRSRFLGGQPLPASVVELDGGSMLEMTPFEPDPTTFRGEYYYNTARNVLYKKVMSTTTLGDDTYKTGHWQKVSS